MVKMNQAIAKVYALRERLDNRGYQSSQDGSLCLHSIPIEESIAIVSTNQYGGSIDGRIGLTFVKPEDESKYIVNAQSSENGGFGSMWFGIIYGLTAGVPTMMFGSEHMSTIASIIAGVSVGIVVGVGVGLILYSPVKKSRAILKHFETVRGEPALEQLEAILI